MTLSDCQCVSYVVYAIKIFRFFETFIPRTCSLCNVLPLFFLRFFQLSFIKAIINKLYLAILALRFLFLLEACASYLQRAWDVPPSIVG